MYTLIIGKSKSAHFNKAVEIAKLLDGNYNGHEITLTVKEDMKAYETLFPLFRLNVLQWKNTRAYCDGRKVEPYRFMLKMEQRRRTFFAQVLEQVCDITHWDLTIPYLYHKREGNRFYFQGTDKAFHLDFEGKMLYDFVDKYDVGDIVYFE